LGNHLNQQGSLAKNAFYVCFWQIPVRITSVKSLLLTTWTPGTLSLASTACYIPKLIHDTGEPETGGEPGAESHLKGDARFSSTIVGFNNFAVLHHTWRFHLPGTYREFR